VIFKGSSGSAGVEGAMVFALLLAVVFGFIYTALDMHVEVREDAAAHKELMSAQECEAGAALRAGWVLSFVTGGGSDEDEAPVQEED